MKKFKSLIIITLCIIMSLGGYTTVYASDNIGVSPNPSYLFEMDGIQPYSTSEPTQSWNFSTRGNYYFSGSATYDNLYSNYYFTNVTKIKIKVTNTGDDTLTVLLLKKSLLNSQVHRVDVSPGTTTTYTVTNLNSSKKYMLCFMPPSSFSGYVSDVSNS